MSDNKNKNKSNGNSWLKSIFNPNTFSSLTNFGTGLISSAVNYGFQKRLAEQNFKYQQAENEQVFQQNRQLALEQNQMNIDQWNRENEYNSPAAQMARYSAAGLNPDLIYGQSNLAANSPTLTGGTPKQSANYAESQAASVSAAASLQNVFAQNALLEAQARNLNVDSEKKESETQGQNLQNQFNAETYAMRLLGIKLGNLTAEQYINNLKATENKDNVSAQRELAEINKITAEIESIGWDIKETQSKIANIDQDTINKVLQGKELEKLIEKHAAEIYKINAETEYYRQKGITEAAVRSQLNAMAQKLLSEKDLNVQTLTQNKELFPIQLNQAKLQNDNTSASTDNLRSNSRYTDTQNTNYVKYQNWSHVNQSVNAAGNFVGAIGSLF